MRGGGVQRRPEPPPPLGLHYLLLSLCLIHTFGEVVRGKMRSFYVFIWKKDTRHSVPLREAGSLLLFKD